MKQNTFITTFCCLLIAVSSLLAEETDYAASEPESPIHVSKETRVLHHLLQMEDHELTKLRQTIERIEKMSPEEKVELRRHIGALNRMPPERVEAMRKKFKAIPREQREAMRTRWMEMSPEERAELRAELREMTPEERHAFMKEKGFLPPPLPGSPKKLPYGPPPEDPNTATSDTSGKVQ